MLISAHDMNPLMAETDKIVYVAAGRAAAGRTDEVIRPDVLSALYGSPVCCACTAGSSSSPGEEQRDRDPAHHPLDKGMVTGPGAAPRSFAKRPGPRLRWPSPSPWSRPRSRSSPATAPTGRSGSTSPSSPPLLPGRLRLDRRPPALVGAPGGAGARSRPLTPGPAPYRTANSHGTSRGLTRSAGRPWRTASGTGGKARLVGEERSRIPGR